MGIIPPANTGWTPEAFVLLLLRMADATQPEFMSQARKMMKIRCMQHFVINTVTLHFLENLMSTVGGGSVQLVGEDEIVSEDPETIMKYLTTCNGSNTANILVLMAHMHRLLTDTGSDSAYNNLDDKPFVALAGIRNPLDIVVKSKSDDGAPSQLATKLTVT